MARLFLCDQCLRPIEPIEADARFRSNGCTCNLRAVKDRTSPQRQLEFVKSVRHYLDSRTGSILRSKRGQRKRPQRRPADRRVANAE